MWRACTESLTYDANDSFVVYFDTASGRTHMINEVAAWLMSELVAAPLTEEELKNRVMTQVEGISSLEAQKMLSMLIVELQSFDLIEVV